MAAGPSAAPTTPERRDPGAETRGAETKGMRARERLTIVFDDVRESDVDLDDAVSNPAEI